MQCRWGEVRERRARRPGSFYLRKGFRFLFCYCPVESPEAPCTEAPPSADEEPDSQPTLSLSGYPEGCLQGLRTSPSSVVPLLPDITTSALQDWNVRGKLYPATIPNNSTLHQKAVSLREIRYRKDFSFQWRQTRSQGEENFDTRPGRRTRKRSDLFEQKKWGERFSSMQFMGYDQWAPAG